MRHGLRLQAEEEGLAGELLDLGVVAAAWALGQWWRCWVL
jgi:hypothetical protein